MIHVADSREREREREREKGGREREGGEGENGSVQRIVKFLRKLN